MAPHHQMLHFECKTYIFGGPSSETRITTSSWWPGHVGQFKCERRYGSKRPEGCFVDNKDRDRGAKQQQCLLAVIVRVVRKSSFILWSVRYIILSHNRMNQETARSGLRGWPRSFQALGFLLMNQMLAIPWRFTL